MTEGRMKQGKFVSVDGVRTHYFEAGDDHRGLRPTIVLLHSAEFGGCAEFSWEHNMKRLASAIMSWRPIISALA
jgi:2-hydroxymuconate-semialdehyde hydrolase